MYRSILVSKCAVLCLVVQSCLTLCYSMDCSPPVSSVHRDSPKLLLSSAFWGDTLPPLSGYAESFVLFFSLK